jgi:hypothetical protein
MRGGNTGVKFGLMTQIQMPRPWQPDAELHAYRNAVEQVVAGEARFGFGGVQQSWARPDHQRNGAQQPELLLFRQYR